MVKKTTKKTVQPTKKSTKVVDFEPNKMAFAVSLLAAVILLLVGVITMYA